MLSLRLDVKIASASLQHHLRSSFLGTEELFIEIKKELYFFSINLKLL